MSNVNGTEGQGQMDKVNRAIWRIYQDLCISKQSKKQRTVEC